MLIERVFSSSHFHIEIVSGQSYEAFFQQNTFKPLQMSNTGFDDHQVDLAWGNSTGQGNSAIPGQTDYFAGGTLHSTVEDLYRWDQALYSEKLFPEPALTVRFDSQMPASAGQY